MSFHELEKFKQTYRKIGTELAQCLLCFSLDIIGIIALYAWEKRCVRIRRLPATEYPVTQIVYYPFVKRLVLVTKKELWMLNSQDQVEIRFRTRHEISYVAAHSYMTPLYIVICITDKSNMVVQSNALDDVVILRTFYSSSINQLESCHTDFILLQYFQRIDSQWLYSYNKSNWHSTVIQQHFTGWLFTVYDTKLYLFDSKLWTVTCYEIKTGTIDIVIPLKRLTSDLKNQHNPKKIKVNSNREFAVATLFDELYFFSASGEFQNKISLGAHVEILDLCFDSHTHEWCMLTRSGIQVIDY